MTLFDLDIEKYFSFPSTYSVQNKKDKINEMINSENFVYSLKTDGNWARFVVEDGIAKLQTRGISVKTGKLGEIQEKVVFFDYLKETFKENTIILGEVFLDDGIDKDVGSILRCLPPKALARQKDKPLKFRIFDTYYLDGASLLTTPMFKRIEKLKEIKERLNNHPLISVVKYHEMDKTFYDKLDAIFRIGGEGVVATKKDSIPTLGSRTSWKTLKIKQEIEEPVDCFIIGLEKPARISNTTAISAWEYWENIKTGEKVHKNMYEEYSENRGTWEPITKNYFYGWPGAITCGVYGNNQEILAICSCSGLTEEFKEELKNDFNRYRMCPIKISGMMITSSDNPSVRHPKLISIREGDISPEDCTLEKMLNK